MQAVSGSMVLRKHRHKAPCLKIRLSHGGRQQGNSKPSQRRLAQNLGGVSIETASDPHLFRRMVWPMKNPGGEAAMMAKAHAIVFDQISKLSRNAFF
jgi:hypothetical protein